MTSTQLPPFEVTTWFPPEEFAAHRETIYDTIGPEAHALIQGAGPPRGFEVFRQTNEFFYLCGVEIPQATKRRLGLDADRSWIITTELNQFTWPGPDIRPTASGEYIYGYLPEQLMRLVLEQVKKHAGHKRLKNIPRTE